MTKSARAREICQMAPVIPVIVIEDAADAAPMAEALIAGGLPVLEVTLRTAAALDAIKAMAQVPGGVVGAGTALAPRDIAASKAAGAQFIVSPGSTDTLLAAADDQDISILPGTVTASEVMSCLEKGYDMLKFFPANTSGGAPALKNFSSPLPQATFCPTGGISPSNAADYLSLPNVVCVGGSWVVAPDLVKAKNWARIEELAREAAALPR